MRKTHASRHLWIAVAAFSAVAGISLCQVQPSGRKVGVIQFDVISEWSRDVIKGGNVVIFARYWVCQDYYALSVVWTEPLGRGVRMMTFRLLSDETSLRTNTDLFPDHARSNTTYPKPFGERPSFPWRGGWYGAMEDRFAESEALARRVYVRDLGQEASPTPPPNGVIDVNVPKGAGGVTRKLARLKAQTQDGRIESMELFDSERQLLAKMRYEYEPGAGPVRLATLVAELPPRPMKLALNTTRTISNPDGTKRAFKIPDADYVYHKGGRTCTVTYKDVTVGDQVLRLPAEVKVRRSDSKRLVRSARFMNYKRVDLDKNGVWEAARTFGGLDSEYRKWLGLVHKFLQHTAKLGPPPVDANDPNVARRLIAKYPVWEQPKPSGLEAKVHGMRELQAAETYADWQKITQDQRQERAKEQERLKQWSEEVARMPRPPRKQVEPNDVRLIRQLHNYYLRRFSKTSGQVPQDEIELHRLTPKLPEILRYHRVAPLPEDRAPEPNESDLNLFRDLKGHYEKLAPQQDHGLGGRLKTLDALARLDLIVKDYDALEGHATRYLQMLRDAKLNEMYVEGGHRHIENFLEAGQYERANRLVGPWADRSAAANDADGVYRFCGSFHGEADPWAHLQVLDRFLKKPGLSPMEKYEGLALRAIALDKIDKLLADPDVGEDEARAAQAQWILKSTTRAEIAKMVEPAVRQAVSAWGAVGPARLTEAKPYSTENSGTQQNITGAPDATRLQETSARLDQIVRQRRVQRGATPLSNKAKRPATPR